MSSEVLNFQGLVDAIEKTHSTLAIQATKAVNISLTLRNWFIGHHIAEYQLNGADRANYGEGLLNELAQALQAQGISNAGRRQLYGYLNFYRAYPQMVRAASAQSALKLLPQSLQAISAPKKVRTVSAQSDLAAGLSIDQLLNRLSYSHFELLVDMDMPLKRLFYEVEAVRGNWSVRELKRQIATQYFERSGLSTDKEALARLTHQHAAQDHPRHVIRDPYVFEFLGLQVQEVMTERKLEQALLDKLQTFLMELGHGFCFEARQKRLLIGREHAFVDLVFYHRILKCHVLVELKNDEFKHEHLGQLNAYVSYYKQHEMTAGDQPPIGILLCTQKNHDMVQYALADMGNPLFVSNYQLQLPPTRDMEDFLRRALAELTPLGDAS
ncbi:MAG TPA: PDDEXK nuclease domain-containing protein [Aquabacterium sp.]|nr:PDDEXK nuclease domain-containing protein [Aquabacterium sp.]HRH29432.1 PDDEXK nuclease domain-containing protein [Aquabacterium sp.]